MFIFLLYFEKFYLKKIKREKKSKNKIDLKKSHALSLSLSYLAFSL
jgi:hypothetical protein